VKIKPEEIMLHTKGLPYFLISPYNLLRDKNILNLPNL